MGLTTLLRTLPSAFPEGTTPSSTKLVSEVELPAATTFLLPLMSLRRLLSGLAEPTALPSVTGKEEGAEDESGQHDVAVAEDVEPDALG